MAFHLRFAAEKEWRVFIYFPIRLGKKFLDSSVCTLADSELIPLITQLVATYSQACCFLRTNGLELTSEELDCVLQVFKGHIQQDPENLSNTDSTGVGLTLSWGDDVTYSCGYRNALIFEMLKLWVEHPQVGEVDNG